MKLKLLGIAILALLDEAIFLAIILAVLWVVGVKMPWWFMVLLATLFTAASIFVFKSMQRNPLLGFESKVGAVGESISDITSKGTVKIGHELWSAVSSDNKLILAGTPVKVVGQTWLKLIVTAQDDA